MRRDKRPTGQAGREHAGTASRLAEETSVTANNGDRRDSATKRESSAQQDQAVEQVAELEALRRETERVTEQLVARDRELETALMHLVPAAADEESRQGLRHRHMVQCLRRLVDERVSAGRTAVVHASGDGSLLHYARCRGIPLASGSPAGEGFQRDPSCDLEAVVQLEAARARGAGVLVMPASGRWLYDRCPELRGYLERRYTLLARDETAGEIWDLEAPTPFRRLDDLLTDLRGARDDDPVLLDWNTGYGLSTRFSQIKSFVPTEDAPRLPYLDGSVEVVALAGGKDKLAEAKRLANDLVVVLSTPEERPTLTVAWDSGSRRRASVKTSVLVLGDDEQPVTSACLLRLAETLPPSFAGEIVVESPVEGLDAKVLGTRLVTSARPPSRRPRQRVVRLRELARAASGSLAVVLDASVAPLPGWLPPLLRLLRTRPEAGTVCGLLVLEDGRAAVSSRNEHGSGSEIGSAYTIRNSYVREIVAPSPSLFALPRKRLLESLADRQIDDVVSMVSERTHRDGHVVLYQPESVAVALEHVVLDHATPEAPHA